LGVRVFSQVVDAATAGERLDKLLPALWPEISRKVAQRVIHAGGCTVDGRRCQVPATPVAPGMRLRVCVDLALPFRHFRLDPARVVHEDATLLVVDKPGGVPVALSATGQEGSLQLGVAEYLRAAGRELRPAVVHRLDLQTSGLVLFAKDKDAERRLYELFRRREIHKEYLALTCPAPAREAADISGRIARRTDRRNQYKVCRQRGLEALTRFRRVALLHPTAAAGGPGGETALLRVRPETGRPHQIRVHLAWIGAPILGDGLYGGQADPDIFGLHAWRLELPHPATGQLLRLEAPLPEAWRQRFPELAGWTP